MSNSNQPLFRTEVTYALSQQTMGSIRLLQPISGWLIMLISVLIGMALILFISFASFDRKARVTGIVLPIAGSISLASTTSGLLSKIVVQEGDVVKTGQVLFEVSNEKQNSQGEVSTLVAIQLKTRRETLESEIRIRTSQALEKKEALHQRLSNTSKEVSQLAQELGLLRKRQTLAHETVSRFQTLLSNGYVSNAQVQQKQEELIDIESRLSNLERVRLQLDANRLATNAELNTLGSNLDTERTQLQRALATLEQEFAENNSRKSTQITASHDGIITTIHGQTGQIINAGQTIATLLPYDEKSSQDSSTNNVAPALEVQLFAPSRTTGFVSVGQEVLIRYAAFPYQKFGLQKGVITAVSTTPLAPNELPQSLASTILSNAQQTILGFNSNEALYRIKVKLAKQTIDTYGQAQFLKSGMTLEADIVQDKRKIWEWLAEPILAVARR